MYHSGDTCVIHSFFKNFFEKTAELFSGKGAALSLPLATIPKKIHDKCAIENSNIFAYIFLERSKLLTKVNTLTIVKIVKS